MLDVNSMPFAATHEPSSQPSPHRSVIGSLTWKRPCTRVEERRRLLLGDGEEVRLRLEAGQSGIAGTARACCRPLLWRCGIGRGPGQRGRDGNLALILPRSADRGPRTARRGPRAPTGAESAARVTAGRPMQATRSPTPARDQKPDERCRCHRRQHAEQRREETALAVEVGEGAPAGSATSCSDRRAGSNSPFSACSTSAPRSSPRNARCAPAASAGGRAAAPRRPPSPGAARRRAATTPAEKVPGHRLSCATRYSGLSEKTWKSGKATASVHSATSCSHAGSRRWAPGGSPGSAREPQLSPAARGHGGRPAIERVQPRGRAK